MLTEANLLAVVHGGTPACESITEKIQTHYLNFPAD